jgi:ribosomal protein S18 acetylase RimI-like enzyme
MSDHLTKQSNAEQFPGDPGNTSEPVLRPATHADTDLLLALYRSTRTDVELFGWDESAISAFVGMQFEMQRRSYQIQHPEADSSILIHEGHDAGRILVDRSGSPIVLVDIIIAPEFRGRGLGTRVLSWLKREAALNKKPIELHVDVSNTKAAQLYEREGFMDLEDGSALSRHLRWEPDDQNRKRS